MKIRWLRFTLVLVMLLALAPALPVQAQSGCVGGLQSSGAVYGICMPPAGTEWNGDLVVYAHGYVAYNEPIAIPQDQLAFSDGSSVPELITSLGYAFATTSYSENGWAVSEGLSDIVDLVMKFKDVYPQTEHVFLVGPSEGGLITALGIERYPDLFSGGFSLCGPVGSFQKQINYWGDFRVLFDYFFPGVIPGDAMSVPQSVIDNWDTVYQPQVQAAIAANPSALNQLIRTSGAKYDLLDPETKKATVDQIMWYNVFATNDGVQKLGGIPFDNHTRRYTGSKNDFRLNRLVARYTEAPDVKAAVNSFDTTGLLTKPLVTMHTTGDPVVPYWHETLYGSKIKAAGSSLMRVNVPVVRYGHCAFQASEAVAGFAIMVYKATGEIITGIPLALPSVSQQASYQKIIQSYGLK